MTGDMPSAQTQYLLAREKSWFALLHFVDDLEDQRWNGGDMEFFQDPPAKPTIVIPGREMPIQINIDEEHTVNNFNQ